MDIVFNVVSYIYTHTYEHICVCVCIYIYIHRNKIKYILKCGFLEQPLVAGSPREHPLNHNNGTMSKGYRSQLNKSPMCKAGGI